MATINPHTTRATGTVLTAAIYNADHQNHITNANALNAELVTASADIVVLETNSTAMLAALNALVDGISHQILVPTNKDYMFAVKMPFGGTINETVTKCVSGTATGTFKINAVALGGTANAISSAEQTQAHASANVFAAGDDLVLTISANAACLDLSFTAKFTRDLIP